MFEPKIIGLGDRIKRIRERRGINSRDFAFKCGIGEDFLEKIEAGAYERGDGAFATIARIASELGIGVDILLRGSELSESQLRLFHSEELVAVKASVRARLLEAEPDILLADCVAVEAMVDEEFDRFRKERSSDSVMAYRRENEFEVDDFELQQMLAKARARQKE
jgi:transcriptional regulator with XRE-family HTH domain